MANHLYAVGTLITLDFQEGLPVANLNPFRVEAQLPPVGTSLQYRIKSEAEAYRRVVAEHQVSAFGSAPVPQAPPPVRQHSGEED